MSGALCRSQLYVFIKAPWLQMQTKVAFFSCPQGVKGRTWLGCLQFHAFRAARVKRQTDFEFMNLRIPSSDLRLDEITR